MKFLLAILLAFGVSLDIQSAEENSEVETSDAECVDDPNTSDNECEDDEALVLLDADTAEATDLSSYLVWGLGIAVLSSVGSDSGTGTATTD